MENVQIKENERIDDLQIKGLPYYPENRWFLLRD